MTAAMVMAVVCLTGEQPLHPIALAALDDWPAHRDDLYMGDVRATLSLSLKATIASEVTARIWWRRRDPYPELKAIFVTDDIGRAVAQTAVPQVSAPCGLVRFKPNGRSKYHVYYLPYQQSGSGASLRFSWYNCSDQRDRHCVMSASRQMPPIRLASSPSYCTETDGHLASVLSIEGRQVAAGSGRPDFHALSPMEMVATPEERAALLTSPPAGSSAALKLFIEPHNRAVRMDDQIPAEWARGGERLSVVLNASVGQYLSFQVGVLALANVSTFSLQFGEMRNDDAATILSPAAFTCFNTGGYDYHGRLFERNYSLFAGKVGSLWIGVDLPANVSSAGRFQGSIELSAQSQDGGLYTAKLSVTINVQLPDTGQPVPMHGDDDIYSMARLRWLNSKAGIDDTVPAPFVPPVVEWRNASGFAVRLLNKRITVGANGFISQVVVNVSPAVLSGVASRRAAEQDARVLALLSRPMGLIVLSAGGAQALGAEVPGVELPVAVPLPLSVVTPASLVGQNKSGVYWRAVLAHASSGLSVRVDGALEYDSYCEFGFSLSTSDGRALLLDDIQLELPLLREHARYMVGMGVEGVATQPITWHWARGTGNNGLWAGRVEGGVFLKLRGEGSKWEDPMFSSDFGVIPFIPPSWGGAGATPSSNRTNTGANVTVGAKEVRVLAFSGPRRLTGSPQRFLFDVAATPSKPLNLSRHFEQRYLQVGYGTPYISPQEAAAMNVSVVTLHQGISGIINGTLVNPYINYPFIPATVALMENYTSQARALGMRTKFYYTIRELSNHAAELFALKAIGGMLVSGDPYKVPQPGYCHDWDCHGGAAWLHQHMVSNYDFCWQQSLSDGEWDGAVCDVGTSRWFNYYVNGLLWSTRHAPHIDGIYYDGINFDRRSMQRVRKVLNLGAGARGTPLVDIHTGDNGPIAPAATRYLSHFAYADSAWNGEGFDWRRGPVYWLISVSGFIHGIFADRLGRAGYDFKALLYTMYTRNLNTAPQIWKFWRAVDIGAVDMRLSGWWSDAPPIKLFLRRPVVLSGGNTSSSACSTTPVSATDPEGASTAVLVTSHVAKGRLTVVVIASWCAVDTLVTLGSIDWAALGLDASTSRVEQPGIDELQSAQPSFPGSELNSHALAVKAGQGMVLVLRRGEGSADDRH